MNIEPYDLNLIFPVTFNVGSFIETLHSLHRITVPSDDEEGWKELKLWYEDTPNNVDLVIPFSWHNMEYPVNILLDDGTTTTINNNIEMKTLRESLL